MKKFYTKPELEVTVLLADDILTDSEVGIDVSDAMDGLDGTV